MLLLTILLELLFVYVYRKKIYHFSINRCDLIHQRVLKIINEEQRSFIMNFLFNLASMEGNKRLF